MKKPLTAACLRQIKHNAYRAMREMGMPAIEAFKRSTEFSLRFLGV